MLRNLASSLFLTERDAEFDENAPKVRGRVVTTISKAKEVRPLVERCITIARNSLDSEAAAREYETGAERGTEAWRTWRQSENWQQWSAARAPAVAARRRCLKLLGDKQAVRILFEEVAPRFVDRPGGYTRIIRLAKPRLGDAGTQAILEFVGVRDRVIEHAAKPAFEEDELADDTAVDEEELAESTPDEEELADSSADEEGEIEEEKIEK